MADAPTQTAPQVGISPKSRLVAALFCGFLGAIGIHRFYVGKIGTGILMILTAGGLGIWYLIDFILIVTGNFKDKQGLLVKDWKIE
ncbi:MAG TPA: TM2 domain-containing protein [Candidatus Paceibacterota bacterium]|nr:TM2 domain-containing protein [Candidatus Paceibacterota bacterium]